MAHEPASYDKVSSKTFLLKKNKIKNSAVFSGVSKVIIVCFGFGYVIA